MSHRHYVETRCRIEREAFDKSFNLGMSSISGNSSYSTSRKNGSVVVPHVSIYSDDEDESQYEIPTPFILQSPPNHKKDDHHEKKVEHVYKSPVFDRSSALAGSPKRSPWRAKPSSPRNESPSPSTLSPVAIEKIKKSNKEKLTPNEADLVFNAFETSLKSLKSELESMRNSLSSNQ